MADLGADDWVTGADDWTPAPDSLQDQSPAPDSQTGGLGTPTGGGLGAPASGSIGSRIAQAYTGGISGAWDQMKADAMATMPGKASLQDAGFWNQQKQEFNRMLSMGKLPWDAFTTAMALTGVPQAFGAVNEAAGAGLAKVLPATPQTPDVAKSFSDMLGTAEQLGMPAKGGPIQTILNKVSPAGTPPAAKPAPTTIEGTYTVNGQEAPAQTLRRIAAGEPAAGADDWTHEPGATAAVPPPSQAPAIGEALGVRSKSGPPKRAVVDHYFDNGNAVRLRMDDGSVQDLTTADLLKSRTEAPEPMEEKPVTSKQLTPDEGRQPIDLDDWQAEHTVPARAPSPAPLGGDMLNALDHADSLERTALNRSLNLSGGSRHDMLAEAARLRRTYGRSDDEDMPPNAYRHPLAGQERVGNLPVGEGADYAHPLAGEPAADLGPLAKARNDRPELYGGDYQRPPGEAPVDAYALEDVQRARAPAPKDTSLFDAIRALGGIKPDPGGDIAQIMHGFKNKPFIKRVVNPDGMPADDMRRALQEQGWFGQFEDQFGPNAQETGKYPGDDIRDLYDLMDHEARGEQVYHPDSNIHSDLAERAYADREMTEAGIKASDSNEAAARKLAAYRVQRQRDHISEEPPQNLQDEDIERLVQYGYEPGADLGAEHEEPGRDEQGDEGPQDWVPEPGENPQGEGPTAGAGEAAAEGNPSGREDRGPGVTEPDDLFKTEPGAVDAQGRALAQTIIPGAEGTARELAAAREAAGNGRMKAKAAQKEPGGLFGEEAPATAQRGLFEQPAGMGQSESIGAGGHVTDLKDEFDSWLEGGDHPDTAIGINQALRDYLVERGTETGHEAMGLFDIGKNSVSHVATHELPGRVKFSEDMAKELSDPAANLIGHHNHPNSYSLSGADIATLAYPGMRWIVAHGHDGSWFSARLTPRWRAIVDRSLADGPEGMARNNAHLVSVVKRLSDEIAPTFLQALRRRQITSAEANDAHPHVRNSILASHGVIEYLTSKEIAPHVQQVADEAAKNHPTVPAYRGRPSVRFEDGIAHLLGEPEGPASGRAVGEDGNGPGETGSGGDGVAHPEDRFPLNSSAAADRRDSASDQMAEALRGQPPGTYRRTLDRMSPPLGEAVFKDPNAVQNFTIRPETVARLDSRSAAKWNAEKAKEYDANAMVDDLRSRISGTMLKLDDKGRNKVYAARELDRINNLTRSDTGHAIVARNDGAPAARFSKPGDVVTLNPQETDAYHALSDMFDRAWKNIMEGAVRKVGWEGAWDKDDTDANLKRLTDVAENSADDKGLGRVAQRAAAITNSLDAQRRQGYHPLMRFGDYYAHVTAKIGTDQSSTGGFPKTLWFELAERGLKDEMLGGQRVGNQSPAYAKEMLARLQSQYPADKFNVEHGYLAKNPDMLDRVDLPAIEKLMTFMENDMLHSLRVEARGRGMSKNDASQFAKGKYDDLYGRLVDQLWEKAFQELQAGYKKKSTTVPGYSADFDRALGTYMHWTSRNVAEQIHRSAIDEADTAMHTDPRVNADVKRYWKNWTDYQRSPSNVFNKSVNGLARWGFLTSMGVNPSSTAVVGTHGLFMAGPTLSVGIGMKHAAPAYAAAMGHAMSAVHVGADGLSIPDVRAAGRTPGEKAFLAKLDAEGILHSRAIEDMAALNEKQSSLWGSARSQARKFMDVALSNVSVMDRANRVASALSAYRLGADPAVLAKMNEAWQPNQIWRERAAREGVTQESMAHFMVPNMVGEYGKANQAPIERNAFSRMMLGMHGFVTRLLSKMWHLGSMGPQGRQALLWTMGAFWLMAGLDGEPFAQDAQNGADLIWKTATGKDPMLGYRIQAEMASLFGKVGADMLLHGPASALTGANLSGRLGMGDLITRNWPTAENTLGAYPSIILGRFISAASDIRSHQYEAAAAQMLPGGLRNAAMAAIQRQNGVKSRAGRMEVPAQRLSPADTAVTALGFTPEKVEKAYERNDYSYRAKRARMPVPGYSISAYAAGGRVHAAAREADTDPSEAQIEAGNYKKGHVSLHGFDLSIETPKGAARRGTGPDGKPWEKPPQDGALRLYQKDGRRRR